MERVPSDKSKTLRSTKKRSASSRHWLLRQLKDPYVHQAKAQGYRSRAAFKLIHIDEKFHLLRPGQVVCDLGCAPGGWLQVIKQRVPSGQIFGLDLQVVEPIDGVEILQGDFTDPEVSTRLLSMLEGARVDLVLSDLAASACGIPKVDHIRIMALVRDVLHFSTLVLKEGGVMVAKVLRGGTEPRLLAEMKQRFKSVSHYKPPSSRQESAEIYVVARGFRFKENP